MAYLHLSISELHNKLLNNEVTPLDLVKEAIEKAKSDKNNAFEYICEKEALEQVSKLDINKKNNLLWGIPYALKDNYSTKDIPTTASSNILNGYTPIFDAEVTKRLADQGAILIGKTTLDELAMGGSGTTGHLGKTFNPWDKTHTHIVGGSSCGSASVTASAIVPFAIGSDTGDSIRKPASHACLVGLKPTWGRISRFGLFPFAPSMDHVGFFTRNVYDSAILLSTLAGRDEKDATSSANKVDDYLSFGRSIKGKRFGYIKEIFDSITNVNIKNTFLDLLNKLKEKGAEIIECHLDETLCKAIYTTYIVISCAEATSNNANLDGIKFGNRQDGETYEEIVINTRTNGFSELIKRRFVIGSYSLLKSNQEELFIKAQKVRHLIVDKINEILAVCDSIILPASPTTAPKFEGSNMDKLSDEYLIADNWMAIGNFGGFPSITIPLGFENNLPFGVNLTNKSFDEKNLFTLAKAVEDITGLADILPEGI